MYKDGAGRYYYSIDGVYYYLPAGMEGEIMAQKQKTAEFIVKLVQGMAPTADGAVDAIAEYFDVAGAGWVDADVAALGITAAQLAACVTFIEQIPKLMLGTIAGDGHSDIAPANYRATLNAVRRVQA